MSLETTQVELKSVGLVLTLSQSNWRITRRKDRLEEEAKQWRLAIVSAGLIPDEDEVVMRELFYPVLASAVTSGNCPTVEQCLEDISETDLQLWFDRAKEINPGWFAVLDKIVELATQQKEEESDTELKKETTNSGSKQDEKMPAELLTS